MSLLSAGGREQTLKRGENIKKKIRDLHKFTIYIEDDEPSTVSPPHRYDGPSTLPSLGWTGTGRPKGIPKRV
jgi:hypothetical protein